jgi:hypothetical protein
MHFGREPAAKLSANRQTKEGFGIVIEQYPRISRKGDKTQESLKQGNSQTAATMSTTGPLHRLLCVLAPLRGSLSDNHASCNKGVCTK